MFGGEFILSHGVYTWGLDTTITLECYDRYSLKHQAVGYCLPNGWSHIPACIHNGCYLEDIHIENGSPVFGLYSNGILVPDEYMLHAAAKCSNGYISNKIYKTCNPNTLRC